MRWNPISHGEIRFPRKVQSGIPLWPPGLSAVFILLMACNQSITVTGTDDVQDTGVVAGIVQEKDGHVSRGARVTLYPSDWDPVAGPESDLKTDIADRNGVFEFYGVTAGTYNVVARASEGGDWAIIQNLRVHHSRDLHLDSGALVFSPPSTIQVPPLYLTDIMDGYVYIPGTSVFSHPDEKNQVDLTNVPDGEYEKIIFIPQTESDSHILNKIPVLVSGSTISVLSSRGLHAYFETSLMVSETTELAGDEASFPLTGFPVLFRKEQNFINNMGGLGALNSLVITGKDGTAYPIQISHFDVQAGILEFWTSLKSVSKTVSQNDLLVFSGEAGVQTGGSPFAAENGFRGVYHFSDGDVSRDASDYANHLELYGGNSGLTFQPSHMGTGLFFNGDSQYVRASRQFSGPDEYTYTFWIKTTTTEGGKLIGFTDFNHGQSGKANFDRHIWMDDEGYVHCGIYHLWTSPGQVVYTLTSSEPLNDGKWHFLGSTLSSDGLALYVDGVEVARETSATDAADITGRWRIGGGLFQDTWLPLPSNEFFKGTIDEVQIMHIAQPAEWMDLIYKNQSENSAIWESGP